MGFDMECGSFAKPNGIPGGGGNQTISLADGSITPKLVILYGTSSTSDENLQVNQRHMVGWSDGVTDYATCMFARDNVGTTGNHRRHAVAVYTDIFLAATQSEATLVSFNAGNFILNWSVSAAISNVRINYIVMGGSDITGVKVGSFNAITLAIDHFVTGVGFRPDAVFLMGNQNGDGTQDPPYTDGAATNALSFGVMTTDGAMYHAMAGEDSVGASNSADRHGGEVYGILSIKGGGATQEAIAIYDSMDADGFTIHWVIAPALTNYIGYLAIQGGLWAVKQGNAKTTIGTRAVTGAGFTPKGAITLSDAGRSGAATLATLHMGAACDDGGSKPWPEGYIYTSEDNAVVTTQTARRTSITKAIALADGAGVLQVEADMHSFDADGVTYDWTTVDGTVPGFRCLMIGEDAVAAGNPGDAQNFHRQVIH